MCQHELTYPEEGQPKNVISNWGIRILDFRLGKQLLVRSRYLSAHDTKTVAVNVFISVFVISYRIINKYYFKLCFVMQSLLTVTTNKSVKKSYEICPIPYRLRKSLS